jgi:CxxC-x17-CxxC domain-containing protein
VIVTINKTVFEIKCTECGKTATVPFKPTAGKPVYCKTCFSKHTLKRSQSVSTINGFEPKQAWARRRNIKPGKKETDRPSVFQWSYSTHNKETV